MLVAAEEPPAIRKLGWLFKLTEVHLWDDSCGAGANVSHKHRRSAETGFTGSQIDKTRNKPGIQTDEDLELANLMGSMGLPVSFSTSKEIMLVMTGIRMCRDKIFESHNLSKLPGEELTNRSMITAIDKAQHAASIQNGTSLIEVLEMNQDVASTKKKKRARRSQLHHSCQDSAGNISNDIAKYWIQRYSLFSLYDSGIKMDKEGWFSVTPEPIAKHQALRVGGGVVIDCFTGVGGNAIQFATKCKHVIAVDIDPQKIDCAQHNATVYGVNDHIDFVVGDFIHIAPHLKGETVFMSPPWGGPDYAKVDVYDIKAMLKPCDGYSLFKLATAMASRVVMFLPRNVDLNQLADMCLSVDPPWAVEVEKNFLNGKLKAITAYFEEQDGSDNKNYVR